MTLNTLFSIAYQMCIRDSLDALAAKTESRVNRLAHSAAESNALFQLQGNRFRHELGVQFGAMNFLDVDVHFALGALLHVLFQLVDFRTLAANDDAGAGGINPDDQLVRGALDVDSADARGLQLFLQNLAELNVFVKQVLSLIHI